MFVLVYSYVVYIYIMLHVLSTCINTVYLDSVSVACFTDVENESLHAGCSRKLKAVSFLYKRAQKHSSDFSKIYS